jgi:DNA-binding transcriptional MerR regulator
VTPTGDGLGIGEVAHRSGVPASTLRYYEGIGLLPSPRRVSGQRRYDPSVLDRLVVIAAARQASFTPAEVRALLDGMAAGPTAGEAWRALSTRKLPELDGLIAQLQAVRALFEAVAACECANEAACAATLRAARP